MVISAEAPHRPPHPATETRVASPPRPEPPGSLLHNFSFPILKTWGSHRLLRCMSMNANGEDVAGGGRNSIAAAAEAPGPRIPIPESGGGDDDPRIEEVREKLLVHLREAADRMKLVVPRLPQAGILKAEPVRAPVQEVSREPAAEESAEPEPEPEPAARRWNLRTRRRAPRAPMGIDLHLSGSPPWAGENKAVRVSSEITDGQERPKFSVSLTREEIDEDIYAVTGCRARRRPKKRPRLVQKQLDSLFPGSWLSEITADSYRVPESR